VPVVAPFRGIGYSLARFGVDISDLVCPPYDVISSHAQAALVARHERNAVRLELNPDPVDPHRAAATTLRSWLADGTLERRDVATLYRYSYATGAEPDAPRVSGLLARVLLEPWGGDVLPHEHTLPGPKADRLSLLRATRAQLSPILAVYFDSGEDGGLLADAEPLAEWRARDADGLLHVLHAIEPNEALIDSTSRQRLYVADGHHRYETALAYQAEVRREHGLTDAPLGSLAADFIMTVVVNAERQALEIRPTHRLILDGGDERLRGLLSGPGPLWHALPMPPADLPRALAERREAGPAFGLVLRDGAYLLLGDAQAVAERMGRERGSRAVRGLDLAVLHAVILDERLGIGPDAVAAGDRLAYTRDDADAVARVARGEASAAILVRPTRLSELAAVASAGDVMPQKSTYFYPKLLTGMVFNPLED
jgi:uncharacterized protein (DUF1015 family)